MEHDIHSEKDDYSTLLKFIKYFYFNFLRNEKICNQSFHGWLHMGINHH